MVHKFPYYTQWKTEIEWDISCNFTVKYFLEVEKDI